MREGIGLQESSWPVNISQPLYDVTAEVTGSAQPDRMGKGV